MGVKISLPVEAMVDDEKEYFLKVTGSKVGNNPRVFLYRWRERCFYEELALSKMAVIFGRSKMM